MAHTSPSTIDIPPVLEASPRTEGTQRAVGQCSRLGRQIFKIATGKGSLTLADQVVVSGANFLTTVCIARCCGANELGAYSLAFSLTLLAQTVLNALVFVPYTVHANRTRRRSHARYAGAMLLQTGVIAIVSVLAMLTWAILLAPGMAAGNVGLAICCMAAILPFVLLREFARRFSFAHFHAGRALLIDSIVAGVQLGGIVILASLGWLTAGSTFVAIGLACAAGGLFWWALRRRDFLIQRRVLPAALARSWRFGRWVLASQIISQLNANILALWLLVFILGKNAAGVFAACMSIVLFSNPFVLGIGNILTPRISRAFAVGGQRELRRLVFSAALLIGSTMFAFCVAVVLYGDQVLCSLFGPEFTGNQATMNLLAVAVLIRSVGMAVGMGLWAVDRPDINLKGSASGLACTVLAAGMLMPILDLPGTALALAVGQLATLAVRYAGFSSLTRHALQETS